MVTEFTITNTTSIMFSEVGLSILHVCCVSCEIYQIGIKAPYLIFIKRKFLLAHPNVKGYMD